MAALSLPVSAQAPAGETVALIKTANDSEIEAGRLASQHARHQAAKQFAKQMVSEHTASNKELAKSGIKPAKTDKVKALRDKSKADLKKLRGAQPDEFDALYMDSQLQAHQDLLSELDRALANRAGLGEAAGLIETTRGVVAEHLKHAQQVRAELGGGSRPSQAQPSEPQQPSKP